MSLLEKGVDIVPETRRFNEETGRCEKMRDKEKAVDYRYFTEPNIPPIILTDDYINNVRNNMPLLPDEAMDELVRDYGMKPDDAYLVTSSRANTEYFKRAASLTEYKKEAANLFVAEIRRTMRMGWRVSSMRGICRNCGTVRLRQGSQRQRKTACASREGARGVTFGNCRK